MKPLHLIATLGERAVELTVTPANGSDAGAAAAAWPARLSVTIGGRAHEVDISPAGAAGAFSLLLDGRAFDLEILPGGAGVRVGDRVVLVEVDDARRVQMRRAVARPAAAARAIVRSPMPGKVVGIPVAAGDVVRAGQTVAVVEAMKMQNELIAESGGRVVEVHAAPGQVVDSGAPLVVLDGSAS
jgi:biotin carboxyl carrier protein